MLLLKKDLALLNMPLTPDKVSALPQRAVTVDTMKLQLPAIGGNKCAQVFTTAYHFTKVIFCKDEKGPVVANALKEFFINVGIPMQMLTDGHNSYVGRDSNFYKTCQNRDVQLLLTEPGSS